MPESPLKLEVECYAGHRGEETPRRFKIGRRGIDIVEVVDAWLAPEHRYFKVIGADGSSYILRHDTGSADWDLIMFKRGQTGHQPAA